eukprot:8989524-Lingulodinium_polyedra.AAC.1
MATRRMALRDGRIPLRGRFQACAALVESAYVFGAEGVRLSEALWLEVRADFFGRLRTVARMSGRPPGVLHEQHTQRAAGR